MDNTGINLGVATFNVNGIKAKSKRIKIFEWLKLKNEEIIFLQETHSTSEVEKQWEREWGGKIFFSHGKSNSTGVAILVKSTIGGTEPINIERDTLGRCILVDMKVKETPLRFVNFYGPNKDDTSFLEETFKRAYSNKSHDNIIIGGDFNAVMDNSLDLSKTVSGGDRVHTNIKVQRLLNALVYDCNLVDIFRARKPDELLYSHVNKRTLTQSRLDFFLIDKSLESISECKYSHGINSDHSYVSLTIKGGQIKRGRGYWKFNNSLLTEDLFVEGVRELITGTTNANFDSYRGMWDVMKFKIKDFSSRYGAEKKKKENREKSKLEGEISKIKENLNKNSCESEIEGLYLELFRAENLLNQLLNKELEGIIIRAKLQWTEQGEKSTRYFLGLEKSNQGKKSLLNIVNEHNQTLKTQKGIEDHTVKFYKKLFSSRNPAQGEVDQYLSSTNMKCIPEELAAHLDRDIEMAEMDEAVKGFANNKSPGSDGLTAEFYKYFWGEIKDTLYKVYEESLEGSCLSPSQRTGVITLLPKQGKDHKHLKDWRPITLLNVDYKIYTHIIKNRLKNVLPIIISRHQTGFQKGKSTTDNLILMYLVLEYYERNPQEEGYLVQIDFEKAFDSVEHRFLFGVLKKIGLGDNLIKMIKVAFSGCSSMILVNGHLSEQVYLCRGLHQGSPLSPILFILVGQALTDRCVSNELIKGITVDNVEVLMSLFADDTDSFLKDLGGIVELLNELEQFGKVSGCVCNKDKTNCVPLGASKHSENIALRELLGADNVVNTFSALGIKFDNTSLANVVKINYADKIEKAREWADRWSRRYLTVYGKVTVIKTLLVSQFVYLIIPLVTPPKEILNKIQVDMYKFIWGGKPDKIKRDVVNNSKEHGGLDMIDFKEFFTSLKSKLVGILISDNYNPTWKHIVLSQLRNDSVEMCIENKQVKRGCRFTEDLLAHYDMFLSKAELAGGCFRNRSLWNNRFITDIGRPLHNQNLIDYGIIYVTDLLCENQNKEFYLPSFPEFKRTIMGGLGLISSTMYLKIKMGIKRAYPGTKIMEINKNLKASILLNNKGEAKGSGELRRVVLYKKVNFEEINPCAKWEEFFHTEVQWPLVFETLYMTTGTNRLLEFQFKLIHRVATSRYMRKKMKIDNTDLCHLCGTSVETIEHQQIQCIHTKRFRMKLETKLKTAFPDLKDPEEVDLLNCSNKNKAVNFMRTVANCYINKKYHKQKLLWWEEYSAWVRKELQFENKLTPEEKGAISGILP